MAQLAFLTYLRGIYKVNLHKSSKVHNAIIQSIYDCFVMAKEDVNLARLEMCLKTATGYWLDCWGDYFSIYRKDREEDNHYSQRIIDSLISPKCTIPSIRANVLNYLESTYNQEYDPKDIVIIEPWEEVSKYSQKGALSHTARFCSGDYYSHAVLNIRIPEDVTNELIDLIKSVKAAGVKVIWDVFNTYDIVGGFNTADDAWAAYHRWTQTQTYRHQNTGFMLSYAEAKLSGNPIGTSKMSHYMDGSRQVWSLITNAYAWYAKIQSKKTDESIIITKKDLLGLVDFYRTTETKLTTHTKSKLRPSNDGTLSIDKKMSGELTQVEEIERLVYIEDNLLKSLELMDMFLTLSYEGRLSTSEGTMFSYTTSHEIFGKIMEEVERFKKLNPDYYNAVQPPILNGERAMWLIACTKNWLWDTPTLTHEDFFKLWEPFGEEEHTLKSITDFEDAYYKGYITFGDQYQPPIVIGKPFNWTPKMHKEWMWKSPIFLNSDMEELYIRKFHDMDIAEKYNTKIGEIMVMEEHHSDWGYSTVGEEQPPVQHITRKAVRCRGIKILDTLSFTSDDIGKTFGLNFEVTPADTTDYIYYESSNPNIATIEDGVLTIVGVNKHLENEISLLNEGECIITITCGRFLATAGVEVQQLEIVEPDPDQPTPTLPKKVILREHYTPQHKSFLAYNGWFNPKEQTLYIEMILDNMSEPFQSILSVGTNIFSELLGYSIHLTYPQLETIMEKQVVIDTSDNLKLGSSEIGSKDSLLSGSEVEIAQYYVKHEIDVVETRTVDDEDNLHLSKKDKELDSDRGLLSGSIQEVETSEVILESVHRVGISVINKTFNADTTMELSENLAKIAINTHGYYINGKSLKEIDAGLVPMITQFLGAIKRNGTIQVGSQRGTHENYTVYKEISILNRVTPPEELVEITTI